jgi:hypothetical protein
MRPAFGDVAGVVVRCSTLALRVTNNGRHHAATNGYGIAPPPFRRRRRPRLPLDELNPATLDHLG